MTQARRRTARLRASGDGCADSPAGPRADDGAGTAAHSQRRGSHASAEGPRRSERRAGPCGIAEWDAPAPAPAERRRRPRALPGRAAQFPPQRPPRVPKGRLGRRLREPVGAWAPARAAQAAQRLLDAGGPCGSSGRPAAAPSARSEPSAPRRGLRAPLIAWPVLRPEESPGQRAAAGGSASGERAGRRGERRWYERNRPGTGGSGERGSRGGSGEWGRRREWCALSASPARSRRPPPQRAGERLRRHVPPRDAGVDSWAAGSRGKPPGGWFHRGVVAAGDPAVTACWLPERQSRVVLG